MCDDLMISWLTGLGKTPLGFHCKLQPAGAQMRVTAGTLGWENCRRQTPCSAGASLQTADALERVRGFETRLL